MEVEEPTEMIYVACEMASATVEMLVDTGAQSSVISQPLVQRLGLQRHLDARYQGMAAGVGSAPIQGKLRGVPVRLGHVEFMLDFIVLGINEQLLMLGLDLMKRFKVIVDLERNQLQFGGRDGVAVPFLPPSPARAPIRGMNAPGCAQM
jgi:DNA damage-inducible protein 1